MSGVALMNGFVKVRFQSREGIIDQSDFDYVIVCAGPINTFNLVSKSGLIGKIESADYFDHPTTLLGIIKTKKFSWFYSRLQNKRIVFGNKPGAIVFSIEEDFSVTIRVRPDSARHLSRKQFNFLARILRYLKRKAILFLGIFISRNFSVAISLDLSASALRSVLQKDGVISELCYSSFEPKVNFQLLKAIDDVIGQNFGAFEKTWENETSFFEETPAAHYSGFLGSLKNDKNESILDGFRLRGMPQISLPGSVSFPGPVIGHPTYLALLSLLYEVQRINGIHFDD